MHVRADDLAPGDMAKFMLELSTNFGGKKDLQAKTDLWYRKLERYPLGVVERVIDRLLAEDSKYFPTLGHALTIAKELVPPDHWRDDSPRTRFLTWEKDPWATVGSLDGDRIFCTSAPCPICDSVIQFSPRGAVIVHDPKRHQEANTPYSNIGRDEWFKLGPAPTAPPRLKITVPAQSYRTMQEPVHAVAPPAATPLADLMAEPGDALEPELAP